MVPNSAEWCRMVPDGAEWCRMMPNGVDSSEFRMVNCYLLSILSCNKLKPFAPIVRLVIFDVIFAVVFDVIFDAVFDQ